MKAVIPAGFCMLGLLTCTWLAHRKSIDLRRYKVEITVRRPDGTVIPAVRPSGK